MSRKIATRVASVAASLAVTLALFAGAVSAVDTQPHFDDPVLQTRYERLIRELRCLMCMNETIADSNSFLAADLRREVHGLVASGQSEAQIRAFLTDRYGDFVLYRPPVAPRTYLLWGAPFILLVLGAIVAVRIVRRRAQLVASDPDEPDDPAARA